MVMRDGIPLYLYIHKKVPRNKHWIGENSVETYFWYCKIKLYTFFYGVYHHQIQQKLSIAIK